MTFESSDGFKWTRVINFNFQNMVLEANIERADFERCKRELSIIEIQKTIEKEEKLNLEEKKSKSVLVTCNCICIYVHFRFSEEFNALILLD